TPIPTPTPTPTPTPAGTFTVTNTNDSGAGSLRQAITSANGSPGLDLINFNIPSSDANCNATTKVCTITPASPMPTLDDPVTIDGYTQPGSIVNTNGPGLGDNAKLLIEINGANEGT